jgi:hypothetical protein
VSQNILFTSFLTRVNPDELLNQDTKENLERKRPKNNPEMINNLRNYLKASLR